MATVGLFLYGGFTGLYSDTPPPPIVEDQFIPDQEDVMNLAKLINSEAGGEPIRCQEFVANVVINRMNMYGETLKEVISKPKQFCGYNTLRFTEEPTPSQVAIATNQLRGIALHLPADVVYFCNPKTSTNKRFVRFVQRNAYIICANHIFAAK